jgi:Fe-S cluster biogenesis protein NfuA/nitrite reductase/ring-hydroxylating ferredoxin subunit
VDDAAARELVARVETLLEEVESLPEPRGRELAGDLVQSLVELYGEGLARVMAMAPAPETLAGDELVAHLLLLHDLHPVPLEDRVRGALEEVRPYMESHGGGVELVAIEGAVVRLKLQGSCSGCAASELTLKLAIEDAIQKAAPDVEEIRAEGVVESPRPAAPLPAVIQIELPQAGSPWEMAGTMAELSSGGTALKTVAGEEVLFARIEGTPYAYRPSCPGCGESLGPASLRGADLTCTGCGNSYDLRRAGRCLDEPQIQLEPVPLLVEDTGLVKVALRPVAA